MPAEADLIRDAAKRLLRGDAIRAILRDWEAAGIRTPRGSTWKSPGLRHMLTNPRLVGVHPETGERAQWKPILDRRTHEALVRLYADPTRLRSRRGGRWLLTGLLRCGICGGRMTARPAPDHRRYVCDATTRAHLSISAKPLEGHVVDQAAENRPNYDEVRVLDPAEVSTPILAALDDVDARIASWSREAATAGLRAADIRAGHDALAAERADLEAALAAAEPARPRVDWSMAANIADTREWLDAVIDEVVIEPATRKGRFFDTSRVGIVWR